MFANPAGAERHTSQFSGSPANRSGGFNVMARGNRLASASPVSTYLPDYLANEYVYRGRANPLAARLLAQLEKLGVK